MKNELFEITAELIDVCSILANAKGVRQKIAVSLLKECFLARGAVEDSKFILNTHELADRFDSPQPYIWRSLQQLVKAGILEHSRYQRYFTFSVEFEQFYKVVLENGKSDAFRYFLVKVTNNTL